MSIPRVIDNVQHRLLYNCCFVYVFTEFEHFKFLLFFQLFVEITCQEIVEKLRRVLTIVRAGVAKIR